MGKKKANHSLPWKKVHLRSRGKKEATKGQGLTSRSNEGEKGGGFAQGGGASPQGGKKRKVLNL